MPVGRGNWHLGELRWSRDDAQKPRRGWALRNTRNEATNNGRPLRKHSQAAEALGARSGGKDWAAVKVRRA